MDLYIGCRTGASQLERNCYEEGNLSLIVLDLPCMMTEKNNQKKLGDVNHGIPSILQVPVGTEEAAVTLRESGEPAKFAFEPRDHLQLGEDLDLLDFEAGAEVSGRKFVYLKKAAALLEMALCNYAMQKVAARGFVPMITPDLVRESVLQKCGFQPRAENTQVERLSTQYEQCLLHALHVVVTKACLILSFAITLPHRSIPALSLPKMGQALRLILLTNSLRSKINLQVYSVENSSLCLTGTAEVPLGAYYMNQILPEEQLPLKMVAFGHCFRTEAGAAGSSQFLESRSAVKLRY